MILMNVEVLPRNVGLRTIGLLAHTHWSLKISIVTKFGGIRTDWEGILFELFSQVRRVRTAGLPASLQYPILAPAPALPFP